MRPSVLKIEVVLGSRLERDTRRCDSGGRELLNLGRRVFWKDSDGWRIQGVDVTLRREGLRGGACASLRGW